MFINCIFHNLSNHYNELVQFELIQLYYHSSSSYTKNDSSEEVQKYWKLFSFDYPEFKLDLIFY